MKKITILFLGIVLFFSWHVAHAALVINEVMYDLSGADSTSGKSREWIEIYNNGGSDVAIDASLWRIYDGGANRTINGEVNFSISAGTFVIFAGDKDTFLLDHPGFSGVVYDTGITTLNNSGATLKLIRTDLVDPIDLFAYSSSQGGAGDGNSLQKISISWAGAVPTPGVTNEISAPLPTPPPSDNNNSSIQNSSGSTDGDPSLNSSKKEQKIKTKILTKTLAFAGAPIEFKANTFGYYGEELLYGKYFWNFGDGDSKEMRVNENEHFTHVYIYPGEYTVNLEYYLNYYSQNPEAFDKILIKVIEPNLIISNVGDEHDFFIKIINKGIYSTDISKWILSSSRLDFVLPKNTVLEPSREMIISSYITNFNIEDKNTLKLLTPQREVVYDYMASIVPEKKVLSLETKKATVIEEKIALQKPIVASESAINISGKDLSAAPILSNIDSIYRSYIPIASFVLFLGLASISVYFIRRGRNPLAPGDDFELLDE